MEAAPDFEALRARRNAAVQEMHQKMADEWGATCSRCGCTAMSHDMRNAP